MRSCNCACDISNFIFKQQQLFLLAMADAIQYEKPYNIALQIALFLGKHKFIFHQVWCIKAWYSQKVYSVNKGLFLGIFFVPHHGSCTWAGTKMRSIILYAEISWLLIQQFNCDITASYLLHAPFLIPNGMLWFCVVVPPHSLQRLHCQLSVVTKRPSGCIAYSSSKW